MQQAIQPGDQMWVNVASLIRNRVPDRKGNVLPVDITSGTFDLRDLTPAGDGLLESTLALDTTMGYQATQPCVDCCGYEADSISFDPYPVDVVIDGIDQTSIQALNACSDDTSYITNYFVTWGSYNPSVAAVTAKQVQGMATGTTTGTATGTIPTPGSCVCTLYTAAPQVPVSVTAPQINSISPGSGQSGSVVPATINGSNFGSSAAALSISGIPGTVSSVNSGGTQISASFNLTGLAPGTYYVVVNLSNGDGGGTPSNSSPFTVNPIQVTTAEVTVIGWLNASVITLPSGENSGLQATLNTPTACDGLLATWALGVAYLLDSQADINYANAWLLQHSGNAAPPSTINPAIQLSGGNFRIFNDYQVSMFEFNGVISSASSIKATVEVGSTPDPCGLLPSAGGQNSSYNGAQAITPSATGIYELAEGRIGTTGQAISYTINNRSVPWIWNVIEFSATGTPATSNDSIFPTFSVYVNGTRTATYPQSSITAFIALDDTYQLLPSQIQ